MSDPRYVDLDGHLVAPAEASVPTSDLGLLYGIGLFTTLRARHGRAFALGAHLQRLAASARRLSLPLVPEALPDEERVTRLLEANGLQDARLRLTVTGGAREGEQVRQHVLLTAVPFEAYPREYYERGATVRVCARIQDSADPLQGHKTTCYWPRLQALHEARLQGCMEALWLNEHQALAEGSISNVFVVRNETVCTPPLDTPVLPGITRAAVLELCRRQSLVASEALLTIRDLLDADEVFLTNALMGLIPVVRVERQAIASEAPGPLTRRLMAAYDELLGAECGA